MTHSKYINIKYSCHFHKIIISHYKMLLLFFEVNLDYILDRRIFSTCMQD